MKIEVHNECDDYNSYRAARVKSLFNAESGANFDITANLPVEGLDWNLGVIVGASGSGKTSIGKRLFEGTAFYEPSGWELDKPIIDCISPDGDFNAITGALAAVGLGTVPTWLRPYHVLSNGEKFRADLAKVIAEKPEKIVIDEFTSVVDRQIAKFGALAFGKSWKRTGGKCVLLSCHYDIIEWLEPDWVFDTTECSFSENNGRWQRRRFETQIWEVNSRYWKYFEPHHYLKLPLPVAANYYVGTVDGELVCHLAVAPRPGLKEARSTRLVVMPEWQGAGVGLRFLDAVCEMWLRGSNRYKKQMPTLMHTSHPGLVAALRRSKKWIQVSSVTHGGHKGRSRASIVRSADKAGYAKGAMTKTGYGGHFRAVQGFRYLGKYLEERRNK